MKMNKTWNYWSIQMWEGNTPMIYSRFSKSLEQQTLHYQSLQIVFDTMCPTSLTYSPISIFRIWQEWIQGSAEKYVAQVRMWTMSSENNEDILDMMGKAEGTAHHWAFTQRQPSETRLDILALLHNLKSCLSIWCLLHTFWNSRLKEMQPHTSENVWNMNHKDWSRIIKNLVETLTNIPYSQS